MGKRYYCEYCDKSFLSNAENRKKHNEGFQHQASRQNYYSQFKDLETILNEEKEKKPCYRFLQTGQCSFDPLCRNSHRTPQEIQYLTQLHRQELQQKAEEKMKQLEEEASTKTTLLIEKYLTREEEAQLHRVILPIKYEMPSQLRKRPIPPSLIPMTSRDLINYPSNQWN